MPTRHLLRAAGFVVGVLWLGSGTLLAQELSPRAYWPSPRGTHGFVLGYSHARGDVVVDRSLPVSGVDSDIHTGIVAYFRSLGLFGRTSNLIVEVPYVDGRTEGLLEGRPAARSYSGLGDISATLSVNLIGAPSMSREQFAAFRAAPRSILGVSLKVLAPTGRYDPDRLINVSANRWAAKGELGAAIPVGTKVIIELEAGAWWLGDNDEFLGDRREQEPIYSGEAHLVWRFRPGLWASLDANFYYGGRTRVGGSERADLQRNSRLGGTLVFPFARRYAIKLGYSSGVVTESGGDYDMVLVALNALLPRRGG